MRKWILSTVAVMTVLTMVLAACSSPTATPVPPTATRPAPTVAPATTAPGTTAPTPVPTKAPTVAPTPAATLKPEILKVGSNAMLSGGGAAWGIAHNRAAQMVVEEVAAAGGVKAGGKSYIFQIIEDDNKYTADGGVTVANKQIFQDKVQHMLSVGTTPVLAALPIIEANKVLFFAGSYVAEALGPKWTYSFRVSMGTEQFAPVTWNYLKTAYPDIKKISYVNVNNSTGAGLRTSDDGGMKAEGGYELVADLLYEPGTVDFAPFVTKLLAANPDIISTGAAPPGDQALIIEALRDQGWKNKIITNTGFDFDTVTNLIPRSYLNGLITAIPQWDDPKVPASFRDMYFAYLKKYGAPFNIIAQMGYDAMKGLAGGIQAANSTDPTAIRDAMDKPTFSFNGAFGKSSFGGKEIYGIAHQVYYVMWATEVEGGKPVIKKTAEGSEALALQLKSLPFLPKK